jgi:hypothetical protein
MSEKIGLPLVKAMQSYAQGDYRTATDLLMPIKDHFILIGGSNAQRGTAENNILPTNFQIISFLAVNNLRKIFLINSDELNLIQMCSCS